MQPLPPLPRLDDVASAEKRHGRRDGSAHRAGRLGRWVMAMTTRAKVWRSVQRGDEERCPRVAVALGLLVRPRRTGQSGRGGARGRHVTLFQRKRREDFVALPRKVQRMADMFQTPPAGTPIEPNNGVRCYYRRQILLPTPASKHLHAMGGGKAAKQGDKHVQTWQRRRRRETAAG